MSTQEAETKQSGISHRVGLFLLFLAIVAICLAGYWQANREPYVVTAYLRVSARPSTLFDDDSNSYDEKAFDVFRETQAQLVKTPFVLYAALRDEKVREIQDAYGPPAKLMARCQEIEVAFPGDAEIMAVSLRGSKATIKADCTLVNAIVDAYMREVVQRQDGAKQKRLSSLEYAYTETDSKLRAKSTQLRKLANSLGSGDNEALRLQEQRAAFEKSAAVGVVLDLTQVAIQRLGEELKAQQSTQEPESQDVELVNTHRELEASFDLLLDELKGVRRIADTVRKRHVLGTSSIEVEMMESELASLQKVLRRLGDEIEEARLGMKSDSRVTFFGRATPMQRK